MKGDFLRHKTAARAMLLLVLIGKVFGQTPGTGAISGVVYDPSNRVVANAEVLTVNEGTHVSRSGVTTPEGVFRVPLLSPGTYMVTVKADGFEAHTSQAIRVAASETSSLSVTLTVAQASANVVVEGGAEMAELESSTLGALVDETAIKALPLSNRNFTQILGLAPGVEVDLPNATALGHGTQNVASNGSTPTDNNIQFNGIDANNLQENSAADSESSLVGTAIPTPDSVEEFRVQTANFDAAYGRGAGANVDLVSKSGTNNFHGSAWEFVRNNLFNANDFFSKQDGQPRADLKQNEFGASAGGPIHRDRTFFFVAYQGLIEVNGLGTETHPVLPLLTSDRSAATLGAQFCPAGHLDSVGQPAAGYLTQAGGTQVACDGSNINPVALAILNAKLPNGQFAIPSPQEPLQISGPDPSDQFPQGESSYASPAHYREDQFTVDIDHSLSRNNALSARFYYSRQPETLPFSPNGAANLPGWGTNELGRNTMFVLADTHTFNSNLVNIARFGYMRFDGVSLVANPLSAQSVGEGTPTGIVGPGSHLPGLAIDNFAFSIGDAGSPSQWQVTNSFIWQDTVALSTGRHNARFGAEIKRHEVDFDTPEETDGLLQIATFEDFLLGQSAAQNGSPEGLSNVTSSTGGGGLFRRDERYSDFAVFAQDDLKLTPRLTLNAGLRYEIFGAATETNGRLANFDANIAAQGPVPASGTYSGFTLPSNFSGAMPPGVLKTGFPGLWKTPHGDVGPRLGFVWQMTEKPVVVLRGGYGIYYDRHSGTLAEQTSTQPPFSSLNIISGDPNGPATLQNPFVPLVLPNSSYPIYNPRTPTSTPFIEGTNPNMRDGLTEEYNVNVQYSFARDYLLQIGYLGTRSIHRPGQVEFDQALLASPQSPVNGQTVNSVNNVTARLPIQGVSQGSLFTNSIFVGNYNSLQINFQKRMVHGLELQGSYVWSKNLDEVNNEGGYGIDSFELQLPTNNQLTLRKSSYGPAGDDRDQRLVANFTWLAPRFATAPALARHILSDWEFSGIGVIQSGNALSIFDDNAGAVYGLLEGDVRAQRTGSNPSTHGSLFSRVTNGYLDPSAFTIAPEAPNGTGPGDTDFGNSGVGMVRGPGQHNVDLAIERIFPVTESKDFRFRTEFFNMTNTPQFGNPSNSVDMIEGPSGPANLNPSFGTITSTITNPRIIQFAARFQF